MYYDYSLNRYQNPIGSWQPPQTAYPQQIQSPIYQQSIQQAQSPQGIIWVQGDAGAKAQQVQPGVPTIMMDSEEEHFYIKHVDPQTGIPTLKKYKYEECQTEDSSPVNANYVTKEEFDKFVAEMTKTKRMSKRDTEENA